MVENPGGGPPSYHKSPPTGRKHRFRCLNAQRAADFALTKRKIGCFCFLSCSLPRCRSPPIYPFFKITMKWGADMRQRKTAQEETSDLQNRFTAYLVTAVQREKTSYLRRKWRQEEYEILTDFQENSSAKTIAPDMLENLPLQMQLEDLELFYVLEQLSARDRYILLAKILDGRPLGELAVEMRMHYSSIASAYERAIQKIRKGKSDRQ